jgi:branched-chain amino acid transport system substrate-binding protein
MRFIHIRRSSALAAAAMLLAAGLGQGALAQEKIRIGTMLSQSGAGAAAGRSALIGVRIAVDEINKSGGVLGRQLELVQADDQSDATVASSEAIRLTSREKIDYMVGPQISQVAIAIGPTLNNAGIMWLTTTVSDKLNPQFVPREFSLLYSAPTQGRSFADAIVKDKFKRVAIFSDNGSASEASVTALKAELARRKITMVDHETWQFGATDMTPQLLKLRRANPDVLVLQAVAGKDGGYVLKGMTEIGWILPTLGSGGFTTQPTSVTDVSGPAPLKRVMAQIYAGMSSCPKDKPGSSPYAQLLEKLKKVEPANFDKLSWLNVASGYDWIYILKYAATGAKTLDGAKMTAWVEQNASSMKLIYSPVRASKDDHFMLGPDSLVPGVDVANPRPDGTLTRAGC